ncbi:hypothetical protein HDU97_003422 [Phlyctochytrium planicorne]|nr:hypothetical protein HDU97_003422 [Phlyctochytrium planicorne]
MDGSPEELSAMSPDEIRAKRLAKMANSSNASSPSAESTFEQPQPQQPAKKVALASPQTSIPTVQPGKPITNTIVSPKPQNKQVLQFLNVSDEDWEHQTIGFIFNLALDEGIARTKNYVFLNGVVADLTSDGLPLKFSVGILDLILTSRLSHFSEPKDDDEPIFLYLLGCWKRIRTVRQMLSDMPSKSSDADKTKVFECIQRRTPVLDACQPLVVSYSGLVVTPGLAESFSQSNRALQLGSGVIAQKLLQDPISAEEDMPTAFLNEFISRFVDDGLDEIFSLVIEEIKNYTLLQNFTTDYQKGLNALNSLMRFKEVAILIVKHPSWIPQPPTARTIELASILGPLLSRASCLSDSPGRIAETYFASSDPFAEFDEGEEARGSIGARNMGDVKSAMSSLRDLIGSAQISMHGLIMAVIKSSSDGRDAILNFFAKSVELNYARGRMQVDRNLISTDGFMFNVFKLCLKLAEPVMDPNFSKIHLIDPRFFLAPTVRLPLLQGTTLISMDTDAFERCRKELSEELAAKPMNFVTEIFFLTLSSYHYGYLSLCRFYGSFLKQISDLRKEINRLRAERDGGLWNTSPQRQMMGAPLLKRMQSQMDMAISHKLLMDAVLLDRTTVEQSIRFYNFVIVWLLRIALKGSRNFSVQDGLFWRDVALGGMSGSSILPLPESVDQVYASLPEWIVDDIAEFFLFISRYKPSLLESAPRDEITLFSIVILKSPAYIKNPHLRNKLVEILFFFTLPLYRSASGEAVGPRLDTTFGTNEVAKRYLVSAIITYYIDVEHSGVSSAFYDKFNVRYNISQILKSVWEDLRHRQNVIAESRNEAQFIKFANLLMNDTTYLLDESLTKLTEIHKLQDEMANEVAWQELTPQQQQEKESTLRQYERQAQSYVSLGNETVHMLQYLTSDEAIVSPFMAAYIVERLAAMLDFNLAALVGPRCTELKVKDPEKYRFNPRTLLTEIVDIFLHLSHRPEFVQAVARDGRSYKKETFSRAKNILSKNRLKSPEEIQRLDNFVNKVEQFLLNERAEEEELGDIPDEFLDPLMASLMEDPVILPTSNTTVDRSTIITQLLSSPIDPFNRKPLTADMLIPNTELKAKIDEWRKRARKPDAMQMD